MSVSTVILNFIIGLMLLLAGRNLFWLCVGTVGFLLGVQWAALMGLANPLTALAVAFVFGFAGIFLAVSFEWAAVVFGLGFFGGGYLLITVFSPAGPYVWPLFIIGGILGACLMVVTFDLTLILISSLLGASLVVTAFGGSTQAHVLLFMASAVAGIFVQALSLKASGGQKMEVTD